MESEKEDLQDGFSDTCFLVVEFDLWRQLENLLKTNLYNGSAILYKRIDMIMFVFPLLFLQLAIVILPMAYG